MNKFIAFLLLLLSVGCSTNNPTPNTTTPNEAVNYNQFDLTNDFNFMEESKNQKAPYQLQLKVENIAPNEHGLVATLELAEGSYFASPSAKSLAGRFNILIDQNDKLTTTETLIETPPSAPTFDPFSNRMVNWVTVNTAYQKHLKVVAKDDFDVSGLVRFVIEPRCTLEEIKFTISYRSGKMTVKKFDNC